jgi:hypothetical protein
MPRHEADRDGTAGLMRLMAPFMGGKVRSTNAGFLANLKRVLEIEANRAQN